MIFSSLSKDFGKRYKILSRPISLTVKDNNEIRVLIKYSRIYKYLQACHNKERIMKRCRRNKGGREGRDDEMLNDVTGNPST